MRSHRLVAVTLLVLLPVAAACGGDERTSPDTTVAGVQVPAEVMVIDVRTPEEFAAGHLEGAVNLNVEDGTLQAELADLDPGAEYIVYCRSGRRSAIAAEAMAAAGFTSVTDLGALNDAAAETGLPIVTG
jgi:rhodanese-related sulfurtransferase